mmetsp:Transcript_35035/g.94957  ORF Transcript_35035/g.94957 Transcript_35035/m.94957 type:complete len:249 (-) Transcript_35035:22-768(-)
MKARFSRAPCGVRISTWTRLGSLAPGSGDSWLRASATVASTFSFLTRSASSASALSCSASRFLASSSAASRCLRSSSSFCLSAFSASRSRSTRRLSSYSASCSARSLARSLASSCICAFRATSAMTSSSSSADWGPERPGAAPPLARSASRRERRRASWSMSASVMSAGWKSCLPAPCPAPPWARRCAEPPPLSRELCWPDDASVRSSHGSIPSLAALQTSHLLQSAKTLPIVATTGCGRSLLVSLDR